tara:strand:- start:4 stop:333 length:330 start_codon:yes stop_codon:yes gene_type:complete
MNKLSKEELCNRAHNKAFSKMINIKDDIKRVNKEIKEGGNGSVPLELLRKSIVNLDNDLQVWNHIAKLIETDDFRQPIKNNVEILHNIMGLSGPDYMDYDVDFDQLPIG